MTNKVYFIASPSDDYAVIYSSFADAQSELFEQSCNGEMLFMADAVEVDADSLTPSVSTVLVDMCTSGAFVEARNFDTFEGFREEVAYHLNEAINFYDLDAHAYALSNVERYKVIKSLARC